ncbi:hypothetical protein [Vibrio maerlii]|uniref:hypothetical protein n=1 Tax=Vibrio maerlii TaxID=2231648 RepID=UPI000E3C9D3B|nr:hypothetical protein [Vibrio maerlii]
MYVMISILILLFPMGSYAHQDDADWNKVAKKIKKQVIKKTKTYKGRGHCDLMIHMEHQEEYAIIKRARYTGERNLCKLSLSAVKVGKRYRYDVPEKMIRIHITSP